MVCGAVITVHMYKLSVFDVTVNLNHGLVVQTMVRYGGFKKHLFQRT